MRQSIRLLAVGVSILALQQALAGTAAAQEAQAQDSGQAGRDQPVPTVVVTGGSGTDPYRLGERLDSGTSVIDAAAIEARAPGTGDVLQLLKLLPSVQFSMNEGQATRDDLRDLRPSLISISGGRPTENLFVLDGVGVNSLMEQIPPGSTGVAPGHYDDVAGASSQTVWVDSDLVGELVVRDSNVSAEFGRFTGGVVEIKTRDPGRLYGVSGSYSYTGDALTEYHLSDSWPATRTPPEQVEYGRERWSLSADLPLNARVQALVSYSQSEAWTRNNWSAALGDGEFDQFSISRTYMAKLGADLTDDIRLTAQINHSPYESDYRSTSGIDNLVLTHGGGTTARLGLTGQRGAATWALDLSHALSDNDRDANDVRYQRRAGVDAWCLSGTCTEGWIGAIEQRQRDTSLSGNWSQPLHGGELRLGFSYTDIDANKTRRVDGRAYDIRTQTGVSTTAQATSPLTSCASASDPTCVEGGYALNTMIVYPAYDSRASLQTYGLWAEYTRRVADWDLRFGLRYDHETFLGDHTFSPRFSAARRLPGGVDLTLGLNRYYGRSYLGYAIREGISNTLSYRRGFTVAGGRNVWSPDAWTLYQVTPITRYSGQGLDSPYNDEATVALSGPLLGGQWRLRGVYREGRDLFSRSEGFPVDIVDELGATRTVTGYRMTNDGESRYESASLEYIRPFGNHTLTFSTSWSDTHYTAVDYYDVADEDAYEGRMVYYDGQVWTLLDLLADNQRLNYATPFMFNLDWSSRWFGDRLSVTVGGRYRGEFERIESTTSYQTVDGVRYQIYELVRYHPSVDVDANLSYALVRGDRQVTLEARVSNLLDRIPNRDASYSSQPWQSGRTAWLGLRFRY